MLPVFIPKRKFSSYTDKVVGYADHGWPYRVISYPYLGTHNSKTFMGKYFIFYYGGERCKKINAESRISTSSKPLLYSHHRPNSSTFYSPLLPSSSSTRRNEFIHRRRQHKVLLRHRCIRPTRQTTILRIPSTH